MTLAHERYVAARFDAMEARFRPDVGREDYRLGPIVRALGGVAGLRLLDLGCGKGRFGRHLAALGAEVVGLDSSPGMLGQARGLGRVLGSAWRLPFGSRRFDGVIAIEVFEHLPRLGVEAALREIRRVLRPGGRLLVADKNRFALDARRPWLPKLAVKWVDERRGLWMYPPGGPVRERWFGPGALARSLRRGFGRVEVEFLLSPEEAGRAVFRRIARARLMTLWTARAPGGDHD